MRGKLRKILSKFFSSPLTPQEKKLFWRKLFKGKEIQEKLKRYDKLINEYFHLIEELKQELYLKKHRDWIERNSLQRQIQEHYRFISKLKREKERLLRGEIEW